VRAVQPHGPYHFLGYSFGGLIAFEMAKQMHSWGEELGIVGLIDHRPMTQTASLPVPPMSTHLARVLGPQGFRYAKTKLRARGLRYIYSLFDAIGHRAPAFPRQAADINWFAARHYAPRFYPGPITLFQAGESISNEEWMQRSAEGSEIREIPGGHEDLFDEPQVQFLAHEISACLSRHNPRIERHAPEARPVDSEVLVH
jgi:thioesterase domain-containing protein